MGSFVRRVKDDPNFIKYKTISSKRMLLLRYNYEKLKPPEEVITGMAESAMDFVGILRPPRKELTESSTCTHTLDEFRSKIL